MSDASPQAYHLTKRFTIKRIPEDIDPACEDHAVKALMYRLTRRKTGFRFLKVTGL
jgi:hypothetical protein